MNLTQQDQEKIISFLGKNEKAYYNPKVGEMMTTKILVIEPSKTLADALEIMVKEGFKSIPVVDKSTNQLLGVITDRDLRTYCKSIFNYTLKEVMDTLAQHKISDILPPFHLCQKVKEDTLINESAKILKQVNINCLPVVTNDNQLSGVITRSDMLDHLIRILEPLE
ncbi:hypothetical protein CYY_009623 [Polysphondylium violaceum]|uniref:CBS domain-containing protein n=1 Tax=Polysphondylium violaceum TaxID=133409 RepID=A0A8J4V2S3_9MYCE|nr:hypothetical protein CYY_009623 [Polysphondylium violaceum]